MKKVSYLAAAVSLAAMSSSWAMTNIQPDPQNPNGYVVARADIQAARTSTNFRPYVPDMVSGTYYSTE